MERLFPQIKQVEAFLGFRINGITTSISRVLVLISLLCFPNVAVKADFEGAWFAYENGNYNVAVREFLRCAEKGDDKCQLYLGDIYRYGHGTVVRKDKALEWYLKSVNQKNLEIFSWRLQRSHGLAYCFITAVARGAYGSISGNFGVELPEIDPLPTSSK